MAAKILLVEDNEMNRDMLSRRLQRRGYECSSPSTARAAWP
jgi:CheY-like chemotaxis protein